MPNPLLIDCATGALAIAQDALHRAGIADLAEDAATLRSRLLSREVGSAGRLLRRRRRGSGAVEVDRTNRAEWSQLADATDEAMLTYRVRTRLRGVGRGGAWVLLRLLASPGCQVSVRDLAVAARVRAPTDGVIKVYISHLRRALGERQIEAAIVTGKHSYMLRREAAPPILDALK